MLCPKQSSEVLQAGFQIPGDNRKVTCEIHCELSLAYSNKADIFLNQFQWSERFYGTNFIFIAVLQYVSN